VNWKNFEKCHGKSVRNPLEYYHIFPVFGRQADKGIIKNTMETLVISYRCLLRKSYI
jgi:hypothetical protein